MKFQEALDLMAGKPRSSADAIFWLILCQRFNGLLGSIIWQPAARKLSLYLDPNAQNEIEIDYEDFELHLMQASLQE